jgi:aldehyde dehydrogenase (NAD+)
MLEQIFLHQQQRSLQLRSEDLSARQERLDLLQTILADHQEEWTAALYEDFRKPTLETLATEVYPLLKELEHFQKNLETWAAPSRKSTPLTFWGTKAWTKHEPRGTCLIISPWNYPLQLSLAPAIAALAAGNTVILKPSEYARHTSRLLHKLVSNYFNPHDFIVIEGAQETTEALLKLPFDHIFFTGSSAVGKIVMKAASEHLASVTLELGGKSPVIVDSSANLELAAKKILWGKILNAGQTCIAPDYVLVQTSVLEDFIAALKKQSELYGTSATEIKNNPDIARIISSKQFKRLKSLFDDAIQKGAKIVFGGDSDEGEKFFAPTVLTQVPADASLLKEEIFGPILPLVPVKDIHEAIHWINERPKPLAIYVFSSSKWNIRQVSQETSSGSIVINEVILQAGHPELPFGGVGASGLGNYHGHYGFKAFSHEKPYLKRSWLSGLIESSLYPPYTAGKLKQLRRMISWRI